MVRCRYLEEGELRALGNLARAHAKAGNFKKAAQLYVEAPRICVLEVTDVSLCVVCRWTDKLGRCSDSAEKAWMQHEIGYCYLTLNDPLRAMQCGVSAYENAEAADDSEWQINSCLLIAQSHRRWTLTALILNGCKRNKYTGVCCRNATRLAAGAGDVQPSGTPDRGVR